MRKQITIITLGIMMLAGVMAMSAGDTMTFEVDFTNPVYTVVGNSSNLEGLNIVFENGNISISPEINYKTDNFTLIFFDNLTKEIIKEVSRGSSGGGRWIEKIIENNVTVYVPEYINTTVTVEKIVTETIVVEKGYKSWQVLLGLALGLFIGWFVMKVLYDKRTTRLELEEVERREYKYDDTRR